MTAPRGPLLTLEPLLEAVREGVTRAGWTPSGLQKTTSFEFEGRWEGEATRSAYAFFHQEGGWDGASVEAYLDETSRGLTGNLQLVVDGPTLAELGDPEQALASVAGAARACLPEGYRLPVTLRFRLDDAGQLPGEAAAEWRVKLRLPRTALDAGAGAVAALASATVASFGELLAHAGLRAHARLE